MSTNFISKWKKDNIQDSFRYFENFRKKLNFIVYFKETFPEIFELDRKFKLKSSYAAFKLTRSTNFVSELEIG